jgi:hypothetical protein
MSNISHQRELSIIALRRHERARARAIKSKSLPLTTIIDFVNEEDDVDLETDTESDETGE